MLMIIIYIIENTNDYKKIKSDQKQKTWLIIIIIIFSQYYE